MDLKKQLVYRKKKQKQLDPDVNPLSVVQHVETRWGLLEMRKAIDKLYLENSINMGMNPDD